MPYDSKGTLRNGTWDGRLLADHLNSPDVGSWRQRVIDLVNLLRELPRLAQEAYRSREIDSYPTISYALDGPREHRRVVEEINRRLNRYRFQRQVLDLIWTSENTPPVFDIGYFGIQPIEPKLQRIGAATGKLQKWGKPSELTTVNLLLRIFEAGAIDRVRQCECGQWFWATRRSQHYCAVRHRRRGQRRRQNPKALALYQKAYRRKEKIEKLEIWLNGKLRPSEKQAIRSQISELKKERKELREQWRRILYGKK